MERPVDKTTKNQLELTALHQRFAQAIRDGNDWEASKALLDMRYPADAQLRNVDDDEPLLAVDMSLLCKAATYKVAAFLDRDKPQATSDVVNIRARAIYLLPRTQRADASSLKDLDKLSVQFAELWKELRKVRGAKKPSTDLQRRWDALCHAAISQLSKLEVSTEPDAEVVEVLRQALEDPAESVRSQASSAYKQLGLSVPEIQSETIAGHDTLCNTGKINAEMDMRANSVEVLGRPMPTPSATPVSIRHNKARMLAMLEQINTEQINTEQINTEQ